MRIITGGQTGVDEAGWRAAKALGIPTWGFMPKGFHTEAGPRPDFAELYGAKELDVPGYRLRTLRNVWASDAVLVLGNVRSPGSRLTIDEAARSKRPVYAVEWDASGFDEPARKVAQWIHRVQPRDLMIAGNRESTSPGIGEAAFSFLLRVLDKSATAEERESA